MEICGQSLHFSLPLTAKKQSNFSTYFKITSFVLGLLSLLVAYTIFTGGINSLGNSAGYAFLALGTLAILSSLFMHFESIQEKIFQTKPTNPKKMEDFNGTPDQKNTYYTIRLGNPGYPNNSYVKVEGPNETKYIYKTQLNGVRSITVKNGSSLPIEEQTLLDNILNNFSEVRVERNLAE